MLDAIVDRREMKDMITRVLRFGAPPRAAARAHAGQGNRDHDREPAPAAKP
jgi:hypothetical protein